MCGRYRFDDGRDSIELGEIIDGINRRAAVEPVKTSGDICPTDVAPVLASSQQLKPTIFWMRWGYRLADGRHIINARSETAMEKPMFRDGMLRRRCAVPATRYYEWERAGGKKTKYAIWPTGTAMFYMAGIYRLEADRPVFTILTRETAASIAFIHDRMPVILPGGLARAWIDPRNRADEFLAQAVLEVSCQADVAEQEQLSMPI